MIELANHKFRLSLDANGAITALYLQNDPFGTNFILSAKEEPWVPAEKHWGLGFVSAGFQRVQIDNCVEIRTDGNTVTSRYEIPITVSRFGCVWDGDIEKSRMTYTLEVIIRRTLQEDCVEETFFFVNHGTRYLILDEVGLYSSFRDTYTSGENALDTHVNQHIWMGGNHAYIEAQRQSGKAPHMGLIATQGSFTAYHIEEKNTSNFRGVVAMIAKDIRIAPEGQWVASRRIVTFTDREDFRKQICALTGYPCLDYNHLVAVQGEPFRFRILDKGQLHSITVGGKEMTANGDFLTCTLEAPGEYSGHVYYGDGKVANLRLRVIEPIEDLLRKRARFIAEHQQVTDPESPLFGAYMPYDNVRRKMLFPEDIADIYHCYPDKNEARERMGMGAFLAAYARVYADDSILPSLKRYAAFLEKYVIDENYDVWDSFERQASVRYYQLMSPLENNAQDMRFRTYNYMFALAFFSELYALTKDMHYAEIYAGVMNRFAEKYGLKRPPCLFGTDAGTLQLLRDAGMDALADKLMDYLKTWVYHLKEIDDRYDPSEVAYEQGISAAAFRELADYYLVTGDKALLGILESSKNRALAFDGDQPDYRCYHTPIRHWDGFWFGGLELWGDTFPHYWTCISAEGYWMYAKITGNMDFAARAQDILRNNLALIEPDGSCWNCYMYPERINGRPAGRADTFANDQDWAFYGYLRAAAFFAQN